MPAHFLYDVKSTISNGSQKLISHSHLSPTWIVGTRVVTLYGSGVVLKSDIITGMHEVDLSCFLLETR